MGLKNLFLKLKSYESWENSRSWLCFSVEPCPIF